MIITKDWIIAHQTARGSWNAKQLNCLGISWPPPKGWKGRLAGCEIDQLTKNRFEMFAGEPAKDKTKELQRQIASLTARVDELEAILTKKTKESK